MEFFEKNGRLIGIAFLGFVIIGAALAFINYSTKNKEEAAQEKLAQIEFEYARYKQDVALSLDAKTQNTPVIVERIVEDIDEIVKIVRFDGWQDTDAGRQEVTKALRKVIYLKYKIKDNELFDKAYSYVEMYY